MAWACELEVLGLVRGAESRGDRAITNQPRARLLRRLGPSRGVVSLHGPQSRPLREHASIRKFEVRAPLKF